LGSYSVYAEVRLANGIFSYKKPITIPAANLGSSCSSDTTQVSATANTTTASTTYALVDSMTITPGAGDYLVWFSGTLSNSVAGTQHVSLFLDGSQITHSEREITTEGSIPTTPFVVATHAYISGVTAGQAINVQWKTSAGTATMLERTLVVSKISGADVTQVYEIPTNPATTTNTNYEQINSMTVTPGAGDYLIWFSGSIMNTVKPSVQHVSLFVNGSQLAHTEREVDQEESLTTTYFPVATHARKVSVGDGEAIAVYWKVDTGTATMKARTLTVYKINAANSSEASATLDNTTTSASYTPVDSMSITPGAGNYHVWFSASLVDPQATDTINVSLFVGGTQVLHTEREIWVEGSLDNPHQTFPVALHAYVEGVGASDAIDVRWKRTGSGTATMHERTLVVYKPVAADLDDFPLLIDITDTDLRDKAQADGHDIIFRALDDTICDDLAPAPCTLDHEVEKWDGGTGELIAWVRIPKLSASSDTTIYMYYGNPNVYESTENPAGVWDSNYQAVWHLKETTGGTDAIIDSTGNARHGTDVGNPTLGATGQIDGAVDFGNPNTTRRIDTKDFMSSGVTQFTAEAWVFKEATKDARIIYKNNVGNTGNPVFGLASGGSDTIRCRLRISDGSGTDYNVGTISLNTWTHVACTYDGSNVRAYKNGQEAGFVGETGTLAATNDVVVIAQNEAGTSTERHWPGVIDEVRISSIARDACWIGTEYNNQIDPGVFYSVGVEEATASTAVSLLSFTAEGQSSSVLVEWETAQEIRNVGFNLYRAENLDGPFTRLNDRLIPGLTFSVRGKSYSFVDNDATRGTLYYYKLEDIDISGKRTMHGPISVDWDADGMADDWEIAYGFNPLLNDANDDPDGDGLTNLEEYEHETDPFNPDSDGDGIPDGQESGKVDRGEPVESRTLTKGVQILASDDSGVTLELRTENYEMEVVQVGETVFQRLRISDYIHGFTSEVGKPELPMKGLLLDLPDGVSTTLKVEETESQTLEGYWIYPVPEKAVSGEEGAEHVAEFFAMDEVAYSSDAFYPAVFSEVGESYLFRDQEKLQVRFYPFSFNPATKELTHYTRIRVRVEYNVTPTTTRSASRALALPVPSSPSSSPSSRALAWTPPSPNPIYKMLVLDEGIYRLTGSWLTSNGVDVAGMIFDQIRFYNLGQELPIKIYDQDGDNLFDPNDYIEFYGKAVQAPYAKYTKENVYWLTDSGVPGALRMGVIDGTPVSAPLRRYIATVHHEEDEEYVNLAPGRDSLDRWFFADFAYGTGITGGPDPVPVNFSMSLPGVAGQGSLKISMLGLTEGEHEVEVSVNGLVRTYTWSGLVPFETTISGVNFFDGNDPSTVTVTFRCFSGVDPLYPDGIAVDWFEATYLRDLAAENDTLKFSEGAGSACQVAGFSGSEILAFDITSEIDVKQVGNVEITDSGGSYTLDMEPWDVTGERTYLVLSTTELKVPIEITEVVDPDLSNGANGADYILITHRDLGWDGTGTAYPWLNDLVALREGQGLRVKVVDVADIYNEFGYGIVTPQAIKDFLTHAYNNWTSPAPRYVLLVGDSTYDYKDNLGLGTINYVPTYLSWTDYMGETLTDDWFARVSGNDAVPDLYIGRLPAASVAEVDAMVSKIVFYESTPNTKTWEKNVLLIADDQTADYEVIFEFMSNDVAALIPKGPEGMNSPFTEYLADYPDPADLRVTIKDKINNDGTLIVNYGGHGSVQIWTLDPIFDVGDVAALTNSNKYPFFVSMTCLTGFFGYPEAWNFPSMAEVLLRSANKGAMAAFMSTGMTQPEGQRILDVALFDAIFKQDKRALGAAISVAKQTLLANGAEYEDVSKTFLLFGDPATKLKIPLPTVPSGLVAEVQGSSVVLIWQGATDANGGAIAGYNVYRSTTPGGPYTKVNTALITGTGFTDTSAQTGTFYYVVRSEDSDGYESAPSIELVVLAGARTVSTTLEGSVGGSGGGGCFISTIGGI
jgi:hypothetical protein